MRRIKINQLKGNEILAKDIYTQRGAILIAAGTKMRKDYIEKLKEQNITDLFVDDEISRDIDVEDITEESIAKTCSKEIQEVIEKYSYSTDEELKKINVLAAEVINEVFEQKEVLYTISNVRDFSRSLYQHSLSVASLSTLLAIKSGYTKEQTKEITLGALLHDIGFMSITVPYQGVVLEEADEQTQREIKRHVVYGYSDVENKDWIGKKAKEIVLYHHERNDKSGYPFKMSGERLHREVKLVAICDEFDNCVYGNLRQRMKVYEALEYLVGMSGTKFDNKLVKKFVESVAPYPTGSLVLLNTNERAIVIRQNKHTPTRPVVKTIVNENGEWGTGDERNLMEELSLFIIDTIED